MGVYLAAYPLHEGEYDFNKDAATNDRFMNERRVRGVE
jgi:hypothetical protein